jgi:HAD superfamily hydrolase (TIGR01509 family)
MDRKSATDKRSAGLRIFPLMFGESRPVAFRAPPRLLPPVRGVLFDMCNVLYDDSAWRRWLLRILTQLGLQTNYQSFFHLWDRDHLDAVYRGQWSFCEALERFLQSAGMSRGQIEEVQAACHAFRRTTEESLRPLPGVRTTIGRLAEAGFVLGTLCNSDLPSASLGKRIERLGIGGCFSATVSSIDLGLTMPDAECYRAALHAMGLQADDMAFVGHDAAELAGAKTIGMTTVAFNFDPNAQADAHLNRLEELLDVLPSPHVPLAAAG